MNGAGRSRLLPYSGYSSFRIRRFPSPLASRPRPPLTFVRVFEIFFTGGQKTKSRSIPLGSRSYNMIADLSLDVWTRRPRGGLLATMRAPTRAKGATGVRTRSWARCHVRTRSSLGEHAKTSRVVRMLARGVLVQTWHPPVPPAAQKVRLPTFGRRLPGQESAGSSHESCWPTYSSRSRRSFASTCVPGFTSSSATRPSRSA